MDPDDNCDRTDHIGDVGLSDCKYLPTTIEFSGQDPLGQQLGNPNTGAILLVETEDASSPLRLSKSLGRQADSLSKSPARMYALDRISRACCVIVSRKIVHALLDVLVKTLSFEEISQALFDLGIDSAQSLLDFMMVINRSKPELFFKTRTEDSSVARKLVSTAVNRPVWDVVSVAVKVFLCQRADSFSDVARYCNSVLLREAKGRDLCVRYAK